MSCKNEDFPTPVSPARRMVMMFDVAMIPFLRDFTLLEELVKTIASKRSL